MCTDKVEDEIHFLTQCKLYGTHDHYWATIYEKVPQLPNMSKNDQFIFIMTQEDPELTNLIMKMNSEWMLLRNFLHENFFNQK